MELHENRYIWYDNGSSEFSAFGFRWGGPSREQIDDLMRRMILKDGKIQVKKFEKWH